MIKKNDVVKLSVKSYTLEGELVEESIKEVPLGRGYLITKLDQLMIGKKEGKTYDEIVEKPFGDRSQELIKLIPTKLFRRDNINPYPGLIVNVDGLIGVIKSASPGRVMVDFNHPLAGRTINFKLKVIKKIVKKNDQARAIIESITGNKAKSSVKGGFIDIKINEKLPENVLKRLLNELKEVVGLKPRINLQ